MWLKNYLGLLNENKTMIEYLVLYEDSKDHNEKNRTIYVPLLGRTFKSEDGLKAFFEAMNAIQEYVGWHGKNENTFVSVAWQGETRTVQHDVPYDKGSHIIIERNVIDDTHNQLLAEFYENFTKNQNKNEPKIVKEPDQNFWDII